VELLALCANIFVARVCALTHAVRPRVPSTSFHPPQVTHFDWRVSRFHHGCGMLNRTTPHRHGPIVTLNLPLTPHVRGKRAPTYRAPPLSVNNPSSAQDY
jgi:hypothetical protein